MPKGGLHNVPALLTRGDTRGALYGEWGEEYRRRRDGALSRPFGPAARIHNMASMFETLCTSGSANAWKILGVARDF